MPNQNSFSLTDEEVKAIAERIKAGQTAPAPSEAEAPPSRSWGGAIVEGIKNIPSSAMNFGRNLIGGVAQAVTSPIETGKAIVDTGVGLGEKLVGAEIDTPEEQGRQQYADAVTNYVSSRYGSEEGFKNAIATDPVGVLADFSSIAIPTGELIQGLGTLSKSSKLAGIGRGLVTAGTTVEPVSGAFKLAGKGAQLLIPKALPKALYPNFSGAVPLAKRGPMKFLALAEERMPNLGGSDGLREALNGIGNKIDEMVKSANLDDTMTIPLDSLLDEFGDIKARAKSMGDSTAPLDNLEKQIRAGNPAVLDVAQAQELKKGLHRQLESVYSQTREPQLKVQGKKSVATKARKAIEEFIPEIKAVNKEWGEHKALLNEIDKLAGRIESRGPVGLGGVGRGLLGGAVGGPAVGATSVVIGMPQVRAKLAILLDRMRRTGSLTPARYKAIMDTYVTPVAAGTMAGAATAEAISEMPPQPVTPYIEPAPEQKRPNALFAPILTL